MGRFSYFATCARGLEPILAEELRQLTANDVATGRGGVGFRGDRNLLYRANVHLRTAIRVLQPILHMDIRTPDELYEAVKAVDWSTYMLPDHTLAVDCNVRNSAITHSQYAARRVKDAICDQFRERVGRRPSVNAERPMVGFNLHIDNNKGILSLDSSGDSLHKRGYRPIQTIAPLNEALAAGLILQTGYHGDRAFADPMCGSGTLCIEASWIALNRPPGLTRKHFGFMGWPDYDVAAFADLRADLRKNVKTKLTHTIVGADARREAVESSRANSRSAGVGNLLNFTVADLRKWHKPAETGTLVCNPPYGERIGDEKDLKPLYRAIGDLIRGPAADWDVWIFTGNQKLASEISIDPVTEIPFYNGRIPCRYMKFR